jgi:hypothetical protein
MNPSFLNLLLHLRYHDLKPVYAVSGLISFRYKGLLNFVSDPLFLFDQLIKVVIFGLDFLVEDQAVKLLGLLISLSFKKYTSVCLHHGIDLVLVFVQASLKHSLGKLTLQNDQLLLQDLVFDDFFSVIVQKGLQVGLDE